MSLKFLGSYATQTVREASKALVDTLVAFDPKGATEAQISLMTDQLDQLGKKVAATQRASNEASKRYSEASAIYANRISAAELLQSQVDAGKTEVQVSLDTLLDLIDVSSTELGELKTDADATATYLAELRAAYTDAAKKLQGARRELASAERGMQRAKLATDRANDRAQAAEIAAGIKTSGGTLSTALDAMKRQTIAAQDAAAAADMKAASLQSSSVEAEDKNIAAAMSAVVGGSNVLQSSRDRLAALKKNAA